MISRGQKRNKVDENTPKLEDEEETSTLPLRGFWLAHVLLLLLPHLLPLSLTVDCQVSAVIVYVVNRDVVRSEFERVSNKAGWNIIKCSLTWTTVWKINKQRVSPFILVSVVGGKFTMTQQAAALQTYNNELVKCKQLAFCRLLYMSESF